MMRRVTAGLLVLTTVSWMVLVDTRGGQSSTFKTIRALSSVTPVRPNIYTFTDHPTETQQGDIALGIWKESWQAAGFNAIHLSLRDAVGHADLERFSSAIDDILPRGHNDRKMKCFRYLAMSFVGGGFMVDIDVFPLWYHSHMTLSNPLGLGRFTVHCGSHQRASSCLLSGSADEWDRMALELLNSVRRYYATNTTSFPLAPPVGTTGSTRPIWSDDTALQEIVSFANPTGHPLAKQESQVLSLIQAQDMQSSRENFKVSDCHEYSRRVAVKLGASVDFIQVWMQEWNKECINTVILPIVSQSMEG